MSENLSNLSFRKGIVDNLFEKMGDASMQDAPPSKEALAALAEEFLIGKATTYGVTTFYDFMKPENRDKKVYVCNGTACVCAGKQDAVAEKLQQHFKKEEIGHITCLGRCHENGAFQYEGHNYSGDDLNMEQLINQKTGKQDKYHVGAPGKAVLTTAFSGEDARDLLQEALQKSREQLLDEIIDSGLRGRGGAGFPMGIKLKSCKEEESDLKFIICNADEGDPGAYSDRYLLEQQPQAVLFGMMIAGYITGADWGVLYIRAEYPEALNIIENTVEEWRQSGLLGFDILGHKNFNFDFKIIKAQGAYICGEETALINSIEGQRPEVRTRPPFPTQQGLFLKPTVVNNVETLAALPFIIKNGSAAYAKIGTEHSKGTKLISLDSFFNNPGIYEVEMGTPLATIIEKLGGGFKSPVKAMQIGGPLGGIVPIEKIPDLTIDFESFAGEGFLLGHASIVCIPQDFPMINFLTHLMDFAQYESCGKCFPCRLGTKRAHEMLEKALNDGYQIDKVLFDDLLTTLKEGSLCAHGGGIPLPVRNAMAYFEEELAAYFVNHR